MVVSSQYDDYFFIFFLRRLLVCWRLRRKINRIHRYFPHYRIIKFIDFEIIHYTVNLDITSYSKDFSQFNSHISTIKLSI